MKEPSEREQDLTKRTRSYIEGHECGKAEGMAQVIVAAFVQGAKLADVLAECQRSHPRVTEELRRRGATLVDGARPVDIDDEPAANGPADIGGYRESSGRKRAASRPAAERRTVAFGGWESGAVFSGDRQHRYLIWRIWGSVKSQGLLYFVKHNPSVADEGKADPTFARAEGFAKRLGYAGVVMANIATLVATDPAKLRQDNVRPIGPENGRVLLGIIRHCKAGKGTLVCGWGVPTSAKVEAGAKRFVRRAHDAGLGLYALGRTQHGHPKHLLARGRHRIPDETSLQEWP